MIIFVVSQQQQPIIIVAAFGQPPPPAVKGRSYGLIGGHTAYSAPDPLDTVYVIDINIVRSYLGEARA